MNVHDYAILMEAMRQAQKNYFATRRPHALTLAKQWEKRVDAATLTLINTAPHQPSLLADDPAPVSQVLDALLSAAQALCEARDHEDMSAFWKAVGQVEAAVRTV